MLICAALADKPMRLEIGGTSQDIEATVRCLKGLGAVIEEDGSALIVQPIDRKHLHQGCMLDCGESGSTLRFMLPVAGALGIETTFVMGGRLPERPIAPLDRELIRGGCELDRPGKNLLRIGGKLRAGEYCLPGNVSSQYITGMLLALSLSEAVRLALKDISLTQNLSKGLYLEIARSMGTTPSCIERCIRSAISAAYQSGRLGDRMMTCPSNKEFINYVLRTFDA